MRCLVLRNQRDSRRGFSHNGSPRALAGELAAMSNVEYVGRAFHADMGARRGRAARRPAAEDGPARIASPRPVIRGESPRGTISGGAAQVSSVREFCGQHGISRAAFYVLLANGGGPRVMKVGRRTLISAEAAAEWRKNMEQVAFAKQGPTRPHRNDSRRDRSGP